MSSWLESGARLTIVGAGPPARHGAWHGRDRATRDSAKTMADLASDLDEILSVLASGGEPVTVFGESFGGTIALNYALERPERVAELVLLNTFPWFGPQRRLRLANLALRMTPWNPMPLVRLVPSVERARLMAGRIPDATLVVLPGHGHECVISHEIDLGRIVGEWSRLSGS